MPSAERPAGAAPAPRHGGTTAASPRPARRNAPRQPAALHGFLASLIFMVRRRRRRRPGSPAGWGGRGAAPRSGWVSGPSPDGAGSGGGGSSGPALGLLIRGRWAAGARLLGSGAGSAHRYARGPGRRSSSGGIGVGGWGGGRRGG